MKWFYWALVGSLKRLVALDERLKVSGPQSLPVNLEGDPQGKMAETLPCFSTSVFHLLLVTCDRLKASRDVSVL